MAPERPRRRPPKAKPGLIQRQPATTLGAFGGWVGATAVVESLGLTEWAKNGVYAGGFAVPFAWSWLVNNGGIRGFFRAIWSGKGS